MSAPGPASAPDAIGSSSSRARLVAPVAFSPLPGVLPVVTLWPVNQGDVRIGGVAYKAYSCPSTRSAYAIISNDFVSAHWQSGAVLLAAAIGRAADNHGHRQLTFRSPLALAAIKWEDKAQFKSQQARLKAGETGDNSMLDRSLSMHLAERGGPVAAFLPRILECWHDDSRIYSVLEYHPAELRTIIGSGPGRCLDESTARRYTAQILAALSVVHGAGWCHRDISPENVLVSADGLRAVLIDFGTALPMPQAAAAAASPAIASAAAASESGALPPPPSPSRGHFKFCKLAYAFPSDLWRRPYFGVAFDLWSVGVTLFCMLEGADLYRTPIPGLDAGSSLLRDSEAGHEFRDLSDVSEVAAGPVEGNGGTCSRTPSHLPVPSPATSAPSPPRSRFEVYLAQRSTARVAAGLPPLSPAVVDLLCCLLRVRPQFRPLSTQVALMHAWFSESAIPAPPAD